MEKDIGMVNGKLVSKIFKGVYYEYTMMVGKNEVIIHDTKEHDINQTMSIYIKPFDIHIMKRILSAMFMKAILIKITKSFC